MEVSSTGRVSHASTDPEACDAQVGPPGPQCRPTERAAHHPSGLAGRRASPTPAPPDGPRPEVESRRRVASWVEAVRHPAWTSGKLTRSEEFAEGTAVPMNDVPHSVRHSPATGVSSCTARRGFIPGVTHWLRESNSESWSLVGGLGRGSKPGHLALANPEFELAPLQSVAVGEAHRTRFRRPARKVGCRTSRTMSSTCCSTCRTAGKPGATTSPQHLERPARRR